MKLGTVTNPQLSLNEQIAWAAERGFDFVELLLEAPGAALESTRWKEVAKELGQTGLATICHAATYLPLANPSPLVRQAALDEIRRSVDATQLVGAETLVVRFAGWPAYMTEQDGYEFTRQLLTILVQHGQERGVDVALENRADNSHQLKYFREIFHRVPQLKLALNIGHANVETAAPHLTRDYLFALSERLVHVYLSDNSGRRADYLPLGSAASAGVDAAREIRTLRSFNYDGTISLQIAGDRRWLLASAEVVRELLVGS
jgi:sugar phosphate isomerase/epimerase